MAHKKTPQKTPKPADRSKVFSARTVMVPDGLICDGWKLNCSIRLKIEQDDDGEYVATDSFSVVYGNGKTSEKAAKDYCLSLVEYYEFAAHHAEDNLASALLFQELGKYVSPIS
jgi:hypothetical protein